MTQQSDPQQSDPENHVEPNTPLDRFPGVLDLEYYRRSYSDLGDLSDGDLISHFRLYGEKEGRAGSAAAYREHFLSMISPEIDTLEIGPFCKPLMLGPNVKYFDTNDRDELMARAKGTPHFSENAPVIDFVSPNGDMQIIDMEFDQVFSSHCIEHQPDLVYHLQQVSRVLKRGGKYFLIIPDKRFCFDYFMSESTVVDVLGAHVENRRFHSGKDILEHRLMTTHTDPLRHWRGDHGAMAIDELRPEYIKLIYDDVRNHMDRYVDTHAWRFTPSVFMGIINTLLATEMIDLRATRVYSTPFGKLEFCAILSKP